MVISSVSSQAQPQPSQVQRPIASQLAGTKAGQTVQQAPGAQDGDGDHGVETGGNQGGHFLNALA